MVARFAIPFFLLMGLVVVPLVVVLLCRWLLPRKVWRWGAFAGFLFVWCLVGYGFFVGYEQLEIHHVEFASSDLPPSFDGYRVVHFSDAHVGTMSGSRQWLLQRAVDSINALRADAIVFTGDLQNIVPDEIDALIPILSQLRAKDGVFCVLGNHDYAVYQTGSEAEKTANCQKTIDAERRAGWTVLLNEHRIIRRDTDSIVIAGMENWGKVKRMPRRGDVAQTLAGLTEQPSDNQHQPSPFIVMLQHDPTCWREHILPECRAQLTLSGHTHGGQFSVLGFSPVVFSYDECGGMYCEDARGLYVSTGLGALIPFRLGLPGEIVEITLKSKKDKRVRK